MIKTQIEIGRTYNQLTVLGKDGKNKDRATLWRCICSCGNEISRKGYLITSGHTKSCGCFKKQVTTRRSTKHGMARRGHISPEHSIWRLIIDRCCNPKNRAWERYGGRGIKLYSEWKESFQLFYEYIGPRPSPLHSINRIDNDRGYEPGNIEWATVEQQNNNTRRSVFLIFKGRKQTVGQWAKELSIDQRKIRDRLHLGWHVHYALLAPSWIRLESIKKLAY